MNSSAEAAGGCNAKSFSVNVICLISYYIIRRRSESYAKRTDNSNAFLHSNSTNLIIHY